MDNLVLGKYSHKNTFIHRLDARIKLFLLIILMVAIFLNYGTFISTFIIDGIILFTLFIICLVAEIRIKDIFSSLKFIWFTLIVVLLINIFVPHNNYSYILYQNGDFKIYLESIFQSIRIFLRIFMLLICTLILTSTTKSMDISYSVSWYLTPLKIIKFPVDDISMVMSLTLRFIPLILEETQKIKKAQESRGILFDRGNIFKRIKNYISLIIPLLISSFSRSSEMADAMEIRGYVPNQKRTRYVVHKFSLSDLLSTLLICIICSGLFYLAYVQYDILEVIFNVSNSITVLK